MKNKISTIQIRQNIKNLLDEMKEKSNESYEDVIIKMIQTIDKEKRQQESLLIESCKKMAEESLKIAKEFETIENLDNWEW